MKTMNQIVTLSLITASTLLGANPPSSGDILRQVEPPKGMVGEQKVLPTIPQKEYKAPLIGDDNAKVYVKTFRITGNTVLGSDELLALTTPYQNKELSLGQMKEVASEITKYYRNKGYFVARAYIPAQELSQGVVEIAIIEGLYGSFEMKNSSRVKTEQVQGFMDKLKGGDIVSTYSLERQMLLINDLSGATVTNAEVLPGKEVGTSDFRITVEPTQAYSGYAILDNYGSKYTGRERVNVSGTINSISGKGDSLGLSLMQSVNSGLRNGRINYVTPIGYNGLKLDTSVSATHYKLAEEFSNLEGKGDTKTVNATLNYPIIKTRDHSLNITTSYDYKGMIDVSSGNETQKHTQSLTVSLNDNQKTAIKGKPGQLSSSISLTKGNLSLDSDYAQSQDDAGIHTKGSYHKVSFSMSHSQFITSDITLQTSLKAQMSMNKNLDSSEDFSVGGAYGVRGYSDGELSGDTGYQFSIEPTYNLPTIELINHKVSCFFDTGKVFKNDNTFNTDKNERTLHSVGIGYFASYKNVSLKTTLSHGFGNGSDHKPQSESAGNNGSKLLSQLSWFF